MSSAKQPFCCSQNMFNIDILFWLQLVNVLFNANNCIDLLLSLMITPTEATTEAPFTNMD